MNGTNGNQPGYPENALVPYPVIVAATKGDPDAMKMVLQHFSGYIARLSMRKLYDERGNVYFLTNKSCKFVYPTAAIEKLRGDEVLRLEIVPDTQSNTWKYIERVYTQDDIRRIEQEPIALAILGRDKGLLDEKYRKTITDILTILSDKYQQEVYTSNKPQHEIEAIIMIFSSFETPAITILYTDKCCLEININKNNDYEHMEITGQHTIPDNYNITQKFNK